MESSTKKPVYTILLMGKELFLFPQRKWNLSQRQHKACFTSVILHDTSFSINNGYNDSNRSLEFE